MDRPRLIAVVIVLVALVLMISSSWNDSLVVDEVPHIGAGYSYLTQHDMRLNPEHPPLVKDLAALPLTFMHLNRSEFNAPAWTSDINGQWDFGRQLIYETGNDAALITRAVRLPVLLFFILGAMLMWSWTRRLYGDRAALLATVLWSFSPTVLAHGRLATTDVAAAVGVLAAAYMFIRWLHDQQQSRFAVAAFVFGLALLTKFSTFLLFPYLGLLAVLYGFRGSQGILARTVGAISSGWKSVLLFAVGFIIVVIPAYQFHVWKYAPAMMRRDMEQNMSSFAFRPVVRAIEWTADKSILRATGQYLHGLTMVLQRSEGGNRIYWRGDVVNTGGPLYFPLVYLIKESLAWWALVIGAILTALILRRKPEERNEERSFTEVSLFIWLVLYWGISIRSDLNIGIRHLLPVYPFTIMLVSGQAGRLLDRMRASTVSKWLAIGVLVVSGWYVAETVRVWPSFLTYFNEAVGGARGGAQIVVDSNLDWGQDLKHLKLWMDDNAIQKVELDYFGWAGVEYYLPSRTTPVSAGTYKDAADFIAHNSSDGWLAISATYLQNANGTKLRPQENDALDPNYRWLIPYEPVARIGNSIYVWHLQ